MEKQTIPQDIQVYCRKVTQFPQGIQAAFEELIEKLPPGQDGPYGPDRSFYSFFYPTSSASMEYKVAVATQFDWDGEKFGFEKAVIPAGDYLSETILNWMEKMPSIANTFMQLGKDPRADGSSPSVEWYKSNTEMLCMVKMLIGRYEADAVS